MATGSNTWAEVRARVLARDGSRCSIGRLLGGGCSPTLHVHHLTPRTEGGSDGEDNLLTTCASHHPRLEAFRRHVLAYHDGAELRCPHYHPYEEGRRICETRRARRLAHIRTAHVV